MDFKTIVPQEVKVGLIGQLCQCKVGAAGVSILYSILRIYMPTIVQMARTAEIVTSMEKLPGVTYQVLVPDENGLEKVATHPGKPPIGEIAVFTAVTVALALANTNDTVAASLKRLARVVQRALDKGIRVYGYVSVVIVCPYSGKVDYKNVRGVTKELLDMECYEVSWAIPLEWATERL